MLDWFFFWCICELFGIVFFSIRSNISWRCCLLVISMKLAAACRKHIIIAAEEKRCYGLALVFVRCFLRAAPPQMLIDAVVQPWWWMVWRFADESSAYSVLLPMFDDFAIVCWANYYIARVHRSELGRIDVVSEKEGVCNKINLSFCI